MRLLLDEHIALAVAPALVSRAPIEVHTLHEWLGGQHLHAADDVILRAAHGAGLTLVTYDRRTIPDLLKEWGEQGIAHGGVIFVDERSIAQDDVGGLVRALMRLIGELGDVDWENRVVFLRP
jgi:hypothetical protein